MALSHFLASMLFARASDGISLYSMNLSSLNYPFSFLLCAALCVSGALSGQSGQVQIITSDIGHFFEAYDRVIAEPDSAELVRLVRGQFSFEVNKLSRNTEYQLIVSGIPKADGGNRLAPYTISFRTGKK